MKTNYLIILWKRYHTRLRRRVQVSLLGRTGQLIGHVRAPRENIAFIARSTIAEFSKIGLNWIARS